MKGKRKKETRELLEKPLQRIGHLPIYQDKALKILYIGHLRA